MKFTWGDVVRVSEEAFHVMRPGEEGSVVGMAEAGTQDRAEKHGADLGEMMYTVEFGDGSSVEVPERWLEKVQLPELSDWPDLHDAILNSLDLDWEEGKATLRIQQVGESTPRLLLVASGVTRLTCDRLLPWGKSGFINRALEPVLKGDNIELLEVEMQSGDQICIEATSFSLSRVQSEERWP